METQIRDRNAPPALFELSATVRTLHMRVVVLVTVVECMSVRSHSQLRMFVPEGTKLNAKRKSSERSAAGDGR